MEKIRYFEYQTHQVKCNVVLKSRQDHTHTHKIIGLNHHLSTKFTSLGSSTPKSLLSTHTERNGMYWKDQKDDKDGVTIPTPYL